MNWFAWAPEVMYQPGSSSALVTVRSGIGIMSSAAPSHVSNGCAIACYN